MFKLRGINPMVRAVGTMGAVAALVGGVTFATTSNPTTTVTLTDNTVSTLTANLAIADGSTCSAVTTSTAAGFTFSKLVPGTPSSAFNFCFNNQGTGDNAGFMDISMQSPSAITTTGAITPADITLNVTCGTNTEVSTTLDNLTTLQDITNSAHLAPGTQLNCSATAALSSTYTGAGGSVNSFTLDFVGTAQTS